MTNNRQYILVCLRQCLQYVRAIICQGASLMFGYTSLDVTKRVSWRQDKRAPMQKNTGMHECKWSALPPTYLENYIRQKKKIDFLLLFQVSGKLSNEGHVRWNRCQENCETLYSETWGLACSSFRSRLTVYIYRCLKAFMDREREIMRERVLHRIST